MTAVTSLSMLGLRPLSAFSSGGKEVCRSGCDAPGVGTEGWKLDLRRLVGAGLEARDSDGRFLGLGMTAA